MRGRDREALQPLQKSCIFIKLTLDSPGKPIGRITFELFADVVPKTAENFRVFATGESKDASGKPRGYKGSIFHRIVCFLSAPLLATLVSSFPY